MRILFVLEYFYPHVGGVETLFGHLTEGLAHQGHQISVVTLWLPGTARRERRNGVEIIRVRTPQFARRYFFTVLSLPTVLEIARRVDVIHTTTYNASIPAWVAAAVRKKPSILTVHEVFGDQWNKLPGLNPVLAYGFRAVEWAILHLPFTHYVCDSRFTRDRLIKLMGVASERSSVLYPAVDYGFWDPARHRARDLRGELGLPADTFVYLYFGRPGISKGVEYLVDAASRIRDVYPNSHLVMLLGKDPPAQFARIMRRIERLHLRDRVTVLDPVPRSELPGYLLAADCVAIPSISEGFGYAAVESVSLGCRVVATEGHAVQEVLPEHVDYVPPRNALALAEAIVAIARTPLRRPARPPIYDARAHIRGLTSIYGGSTWGRCPQSYLARPEEIRRAPAQEIGPDAWR